MGRKGVGLIWGNSSFRSWDPSTMESLEFYGKDFRPKLVDTSGEELSVMQPELKFRKINRDVVWYDGLVYLPQSILREIW